MAPIARLWTGIVYCFDFLTGSAGPFLQEKGPGLQLPLQPTPSPPDYVVWYPPDDLEDPTFRCEYPDFKIADGWVSCNGNSHRDCWLNNTKTGQQYNITTPYEIDGPRGTIRQYELEVVEGIKNPDGFGNIPAQLFNGSYPGPRIQACWGDKVEVVVKNSLNNNGTSVHWHGLRQWNTVWNDGVNAITQCPIVPGDSFTYIWNATQYGSSWYHSHYSLQYFAGLLGPLTIYGPTSGNYDHQVQPLLMTDWSHTPVFDGDEADNILQNGTGHVGTINADNVHEIQLDSMPDFNTVYFQQGVTYLLRLINGAADTTFVFSIDNHTLTVISTDFVAITPYPTDHVVVGIGQRYNVLVTAQPVPPVATDGNYWIRTMPAAKCSGEKVRQLDGLTGIVRYDPKCQGLPSSRSQGFDINCADETYTQPIAPIVNWTFNETSVLDLPELYLDFLNKSGCPYKNCSETTPHFQLVDQHPLWLNFSNATILNTDQDFSQRPWLAEIDAEATGQEWVRVTIFSGAKQDKEPRLGHPVTPGVPEGVQYPGFHPIHLHGHDFLVLDQCIPDVPDGNVCDVSTSVPKTDNPPRRDVAFLPNGGYLILAFKPDNPGVWIIHCHIADHASMGLAAQIVEQKDKILGLPPFGWVEEMQFGCDKWNAYCASPGECDKNCPLQTDSGI